MKIIKKDLSNIFDQYTIEENRITHALLHTVSSSEKLLSDFFKSNFPEVKVPRGYKRIYVACQKRPSAVGDKTEAESKSIPDGWIVFEDLDTAVVFETKIQKKSIRLEQLRRHIQKIRYFDIRHLAVITPDKNRPRNLSLIKDKEATVSWCNWEQIYHWVGGTLNASKTNPVACYLLNSLKGFLKMKEEIIGFQGIDFPDGFEVTRAKGILKSLLAELEDHVRNLYPNLTGRPDKIRSHTMSVWSRFGVEPRFTDDLHLTFGMDAMSLSISLTVPNACRKGWMRLKKVFSSEPLLSDFIKELKILRSKVPHLYMEFNHRHFVGRTKGIRDGFLEFDLDTFLDVKKRTPVKKFPPWFDSLKGMILNKRGINGQLMIKARFYYDEDPTMKDSSFLNKTLRTVEDLRDLYTFLKD